MSVIPARNRTDRPLPTLRATTAVIRQRPLLLVLGLLYLLAMGCAHNTATAAGAALILTGFAARVVLINRRSTSGRPR